MPSVDPMLASVGAIYGAGALGVVLTGMGRDGVEGASRLVACGGSVLAQDEASCAVWGMPRAVLEAGLACAVLPPDKIARRIASRTEEQPRANKRQLQPHPRRPARGAHRPATDDEPPLADRDGACRRCCASAASRRSTSSSPSSSWARSRACRSRWSRPCSTTRPISSATARRSTCSSAMRCPSSRKRRAQDRSGCASGRRAARPARKSIRWRCCSPKQPEQWRGWTIDILGTDVSTACIDRARERRLHASSRSSAASASTR